MGGKRREWEAERAPTMDITQCQSRVDCDLGVQVLELSDQTYDLCN